ncbi:hypothetical protein HDC94_000982 [Leifsonia sp. AK011]|nr:hypothetical protein [Leifsonia sp. AK011]
MVALLGGPKPGAAKKKLAYVEGWVVPSEG